MKNVYFSFLVCALICQLTGCSSTNNLFGNTDYSNVGQSSNNYPYGEELPPQSSMETVASSGEPINTPSSMDSIDRSKMTHALDNPIGKSTHWVNGNSGTAYTVVPVAKTTVAGNPYCREYTVNAVRGGKTNESSGTACVGSNGTWEQVGS